MTTPAKLKMIPHAAMLDLLEQDIPLSPQDIPAVEIVEHDRQQDHSSRNQVLEKTDKTNNCIHIIIAFMISTPVRPEKT